MAGVLIAMIGRCILITPTFLSQQAMFQTLAQNPDMASTIISSNPLFAGNPHLQEQMRNMMPQFLQQMQNPAVQGLMTNPEALSALNQVKRSLTFVGPFPSSCAPVLCPIHRSSKDFNDYRQQLQRFIRRWVLYRDLGFFHLQLASILALQTCRQ